MVLPDSHRVSRVPWYSGVSIRSPMHFAYGPITLYGRPFHAVQLYMSFVTPRGNCNYLTQDPTTLHMQRLQAYTYEVWALPRSLAATDGIVFTFYSCRYLDVSIPCVRLIHLCIQCMITRYYPSWVSPFGNLRIKAC